MLTGLAKDGSGNVTITKATLEAALSYYINTSADLGIDKITVKRIIYDVATGTLKAEVTGILDPTKKEIDAESTSTLYSSTASAKSAATTVFQSNFDTKVTNLSNAENNTAPVE